MAYVKYTWENLPNVTTPISKANLDHLETQYDEAVTDLVAKSLYDAQSLVIAILDDTPVVLPVAASRIVGRKAAGNIVALTGAEVLTLIGWTNAKLLLGAGAGVAPTEIDVPADPTQQFFVPCFTGSGGVLQTGIAAGYSMNSAGDKAMMTFRLPNDFSALTSIKIILMPIGGTGNFDWTADTTWGASGEAYNATSDSATANAQAGTLSQNLELDISAAFTGIAANDIINLIFTLDAVATITGLRCQGLDVKYT